MAESLHCPSETITTSLAGYSQMQNKKVFVFFLLPTALQLTIHIFNHPSASHPAKAF